MLHIQDRREHAIVRAADAAFTIAARLTRSRTRRMPDDPARILLLRLERIGDLLMALPAIRDVRALAPSARIDLVVGRWNHPLAGAIPEVDRVIAADAAWLDREGSGHGVAALVRQARGWRGERYDLAINFEPDVRSNAMLAAAGAKWTAGWTSGGGGPLLDQALAYDVRAHTAHNARRLIEHVFGRSAPAPASARPALKIPDTAVRAAMSRLSAAHSGPTVGIHTSGGRAIKQWSPDRFAEVASRLIDERGAAIVLTGSTADRALVDRVQARVAPRSVIDASGEMDLLELAALLQRLDLFVTGDTGPMHLAATVGTPIVAIFGPSAPERYAPGGPDDRVVRIDLPCSPCNRIRRPPARCTGHAPDCLAGIAASDVFETAASVLDRARPPLTRAGRS